MTYAESEGEFATVNAAIRELAAAEGVLLVDHELDFAAHFAAEGYATLMLNDHHPNARGYALVAQAIDAHLAAAGLVPAAAAAPLVPGAGTAPSAALSLEGEGLLRLVGPADAPFQLVVAARAEEGGGFDAGGHRLPLREDALLALSRIEPSFSGRLGADGTAALPLPAAVRAAMERTPDDTEIAACLVLLSNDPGAPPVAAVSPALTLKRSASSR
jgi:hypothetical protein